MQDNSTTRCTVDGCVGPAKKLGMCHGHYRRLRLFGDVHRGGEMIHRPHMRGADAARLWARVDQSGGPDACWPWVLSLSVTGYGKFNRTTNGRRQTTGAHRIAWMVTYGDIPDGLFVCHHCDNRCCCNPRHLFLGTTEENMADMVAKGRSARGLRSSIRKLSPDDVLTIREWVATGLSDRAIAELFPVSDSAIHAIRTGRTWRHL